MLTKSDRAEKYRALERTRQTRIDNVRALAEAVGGWSELGKRSGQSATFLCSLAGPSPRRNIGEALARDIERALHMPNGWLDIPGPRKRVPAEGLV